MVVSDKNIFTAKEAIELAKKIKVLLFTCNVGKYGFVSIFYEEDEVRIYESDGGCIVCSKSYHDVKDLMFTATIDARHFLKTDKDLNYAFDQLRSKAEYYTFNDHEGRKEIVEVNTEGKETDRLVLEDDEILVVFKKKLSV